MKTNELNKFAKPKETQEEMEQVIKEFGSGEYESHKIKVKDGILRIVVEDGVPTITYLSQSHNIVLETLATNSLRMLTIKAYGGESETLV